MAMMTMSTVRAGVKGGDLTKVMQFLDIIADAPRLRQLTEELAAQIRLAEAEQAKALEYAGNREKLEQAAKALEQAEGMRDEVRRAVNQARAEAKQLHDDAAAQAAALISAAHEDVANIRGNTDALNAQATSALKEAQDKSAAADELHAKAKADGSAVVAMRNDLERRLEAMQRLAS